MRYIFIYIILFFLFNSLAGQNVNIDSLSRQLQSGQPDREKAEIYLELSKAYLTSNPDTSTYFAMRALEIAKGEKDNELAVRSYYQLGRSYENQSILNNAVEYFDF